MCVCDVFTKTCSQMQMSSDSWLEVVKPFWNEMCDEVLIFVYMQQVLVLNCGTMR